MDIRCPCCPHAGGCQQVHFVNRADHIPALALLALLDVRNAVKAVTTRGTVRYSTPNILFRVRVPFWRVRAVRAALNARLAVTTHVTVRALSLRDHFRVRFVEIRQ